MRLFFSTLLLGLVLGLAGGCEINPRGSGGVHAECQSRGHTRGTQAYKRCIRDLEGRSFLKEFQRGH